MVSNTVPTFYLPRTTWRNSFTRGCSRFSELATTANNGAPVADLTTFANEYLNVFTTGYHYAFAIAIGAMAISIAIYMVNKKNFPGLEKPKAGEKAAIDPNEIKMSAQEIRQRITALFAVFAVVIFFWFSFHQNGLTLTMFAKSLPILVKSSSILAL